MTKDLGFDIELPSGFSEAIVLVKNALKQEGFGILTEIDLQAAFREKFRHTGGHTGADANVCLMGTRRVTLKEKCFLPIDVRGGGRYRLRRLRGCPRRMGRPSPG